MSDLFTISAQDLHDLITHAAKASSAAADDNKRREREAWADFDVIVDRVRAQPADITDQDFELTAKELAMVDAAWKRHEAGLPVAMKPYCEACQAIPKYGYCNLAGCPMPRPFPWADYVFFANERDVVAGSDSGGVTMAKASDAEAAERIAARLNRALHLHERLQAIIDWADLALKNPAEFDSHGVRNLDGPVFDAAREALK